MSLPFAIEYPPVPESGYWDKVTSTIDWCEENYVVTPYIAEAINTISNSVFILLALFAIVSSYRNKLEIRFQLISFGFMLVGIGSWLFHMTLKYEYQLLDELPMIYATCIPFWSVFSEGAVDYSTVIALGVAFGANLLTAIYLYFKDPTIHQVAYALLNLFIILKANSLVDAHVQNARDKSLLRWTMFKGVGTFLLGYFLWNCDVHLCNLWIHIRRTVGMPYGFFFELHAWWHVFTGLGVYYYMIYLQYLRIFLIGQQSQYEVYHHLGFFPEVRLVAVKTKEN
ncbi:hypothetical protein WICPIJ_007594 [Wickerhamomyces pijperi]|uniref:Alkaline ceramidase n=1 Tax=Wickerhamomyces pijperi TaxID=599730 RepID=A0A9P8PZG6_WICPI|nr:hypothetical protein WICPIJ_007594 [Wickerhamomyces pijperi]